MIIANYNLVSLMLPNTLLAISAYGTHSNSAMPPEEYNHSTLVREILLLLLFPVRITTATIHSSVSLRTVTFIGQRAFYGKHPDLVFGTCIVSGT